MRALLACPTLVRSDSPAPPTIPAPARISTPLSAEGDRGPERWGSLPGSHSMKAASLMGLGRGGWQWVGAMGEAGGFPNDPSKLHVLKA